MLDEDNMKTVRSHQIMMIKKLNGAYSFSRSINDIIRGNKK